MQQVQQQKQVRYPHRVVTPSTAARAPRVATASASVCGPAAASSTSATPFRRSTSVRSNSSAAVGGRSVSRESRELSLQQCQHASTSAPSSLRREARESSLQRRKHTSTAAPGGLQRPLTREQLVLNDQRSANTRCKASVEHAVVHDPAEVSRLRAALEETHRHIEETLLEVSVQQWRVKESKVQQQEEIAHLSEVLETLTRENRRLQAAARGGRTATWRLQAELRSQEGIIECKAEELSEHQKRLAQENARLRREAAAMKSRLLGWRQMQKRNVSPARCAPFVKPSPLPVNRETQLPTSALRVACGEECRPPSSPATQSTSRTTAEASTARSLQMSTARSSDEPASAAPGNTPPQAMSENCYVSEETSCADDARAESIEATGEVTPGSRRNCSSSEPRGSRSPRWRNISPVPDSVGTTLSESLLVQYRSHPPWSLQDLSPAAQEAAEVSAMVRVRAQEALREQGLHDYPSSPGSSSARSRSVARSACSGRSAHSRSMDGSPRTPHLNGSGMNSSKVAWPSWPGGWPAGWPPSSGLNSWAANGGWTSGGRSLGGRSPDEETMPDVALASPEQTTRDIKPGMGVEQRENRYAGLNLGSW